MKKLILSALVVGSLLATSCKKAKEAGSNLTDTVTNTADKAGNLVKDGANAVVDGAKDGANAVVDGAKDGANAVVDGAKGLADKATTAVSSAIAGVAIPEFKDAKVGEHLQAYSSYAKDYIAAGTDAYKNTALVAKGADLVAKGKTILAGLDAESATKFKSVLSAIQSKMAPAK